MPVTKIVCRLEPPEHEAACDPTPGSAAQSAHVTIKAQQLNRSINKLFPHSAPAVAEQTPRLRIDPQLVAVTEQPVLMILRCRHRYKWQFTEWEGLTDAAAVSDER
jgi:hypothetical protein